MLQFLIAVLAVWRISHMLVAEDGPLDVFAKLRNISGIRYNELSIPYGTNFISSLLSCVYCTSVWIAFIIAALDNPVKLRTWFLRALALSSGAIFINEVLYKLDENK